MEYTEVRYGTHGGIWSYRRRRVTLGSGAERAIACIAAGATFEDTAELIRGAIEIHLESMREDGVSISAPTTIAGRIAVPV